MATKDIKDRVEAAAAESSGEGPKSAAKRLRRYVAPKIRTLSLPSIQASPPCNPVACPPDRWGCGPNICGPSHPPDMP